MWLAARFLVLAALVPGSCGYSAPPVPVEGQEPDLIAVAGEWRGEYGGRESGRTGSVFFRLEAGEDTTRGDVLMVPVGRARVAGDDETWRRDPLSLVTEPGSAPEVIPIRFVRVRGRTVSGELDAYRDPECGCRLKTTFIGHLDDGRIEGTFTTVHLDAGDERSGWWHATRRGPLLAAREAPDTAAGGADAGERPAAPEDTAAGGARLASDSIPLEGPGLAGLDLADEGRALFSSLGCDRCHAGPGPTTGPDLEAVTGHRSFGWIYHMILSPDSMLAHDPTARALYADFGVAMPDRGATPWQALAVYEYLWREAAERPAR